jgi:hypothetical protein
MLYALIRGLRPERVLEIGVRWGGGARIIAAALEDAGGTGRAIGIDPAPKLFRAPAQALFGRYTIHCGYSPDAVPEVVAKLGGPIDVAIIDAMHTHDHVLADLRGIVRHLAEGGHVLLHDTYHVGINEAVTEVMAEQPRLVDCGFLTRYPEIDGAPVAYQGFRLLRFGTPSSREVIAHAYTRAGREAPPFTPDLWNWDHYWNRIRSKASAANDDVERIGTAAAGSESVSVNRSSP